MILGTAMAGMALTSCLDEYPRGEVEEAEAYTSVAYIEPAMACKGRYVVSMTGIP